MLHGDDKDYDYYVSLKTTANASDQVKYKIIIKIFVDVVRR